MSIPAKYQYDPGDVVGFSLDQAVQNLSGDGQTQTMWCSVAPGPTFLFTPRGGSPTAISFYVNSYIDTDGYQSYGGTETVPPGADSLPVGAPWEPNTVLFLPGGHGAAYEFAAWAASLDFEMNYAVAVLDAYTQTCGVRLDSDASTLRVSTPSSAKATGVFFTVTRHVFVGKLPYMLTSGLKDFQSPSRVDGYRYFIMHVRYTPARCDEFSAFYIAAHWALVNHSPLTLPQRDPTRITLKMTPPLAGTPSQYRVGTEYHGGIFLNDSESDSGPFTGPPFVPPTFSDQQEQFLEALSYSLPDLIDVPNVQQGRTGVYDTVDLGRAGPYPPVPVGDFHIRWRVEYPTQRYPVIIYTYGIQYLASRMIYDDGPQYLDVTVAGSGGGGGGSPPANITLQKRLQVPVMDADSTTGRASLAIGTVDYQQAWNVAATHPPAAPGSVASPVGIGQVTGHPIMFMSSGAAGADPGQGMPWSAGRPVGVTPGAGEYVLPQAIFALPQQGLTRLCAQKTLLPPTTATAAMPASSRVWVESPDQGRTWGAVMTPPLFPYGAYFTEGTARGQRRVSPPLNAMTMPGDIPMMAPATSANDPRRVMAGAGAGFIYGRGRWRGVSRLPPSGAVYGALGAYAGVSAPPLAPLPFISQTSPDGARTFFLDVSVPVTGGYLTTLPAVPGYPFTPQTDTTLFGPLDGLPMPPHLAPFCAAGGAVWARGDDQAGSVYLFQPLIQRGPIPRTSFHYDQKTLAGAFHSDSDPETASSGRDWGQRTGIGWVYTSDGGDMWSTQDVVRVGGSPLIVDAETVRIAACRVRGHRILLCVCASGTASLYASDDGARDFRLLGDSADGGATWRSV